MVDQAQGRTGVGARFIAPVEPPSLKLPSSYIYDGQVGGQDVGMAKETPSFRRFIDCGLKVRVILAHARIAGREVELKEGDGGEFER